MKWKNGSSCRSLTTVIGKQVFYLEISINDTNYLIPLTTQKIHCSDMNLCHSDLFRSQTELKVIGHHHVYVRTQGHETICQTAV